MDRKPASGLASRNGTKTPGLKMRLLGGRVRGKQSLCAARRKSAEANKLGQ
jgi:hypothetical protein